MKFCWGSYLDKKEYYTRIYKYKKFEISLNRIKSTKKYIHIYNILLIKTKFKYISNFNFRVI